MSAIQMDIERYLFETYDLTNNRLVKPLTEIDYAWLEGIGESLGNKIGCVLYMKEDVFGSYIDAYIIDKKLKCGFERFIIASNYILSKKLEELLNAYCFAAEIGVADALVAKLVNKYQRLYPQIHLKKHGNIFEIFSHIYYSLHKGPKELLYKAELNILATALNSKIKNYNIIANSPSDIFDGIPIKVLRSLNSSGGVNLLSTDVKRREILRFFYKHPYMFETVLTERQNTYLAMVLEKGYSLDEEDVQVFRSLGWEYLDDEKFRDYMYYLNIRQKLKKYYTYTLPLFPEKEEYEKAQIVYQFSCEQMECTAYKLEKVYEEIGKGYESKTLEYELLFACTPIEFFKNSDQLKNCVWKYLGGILEEDCLILFLKQRFSKKVVGAVEIDIFESAIVQAKGTLNQRLSKDIREWIEQYAANKKLNIATYDLHEEIQAVSGYMQIPDAEEW